MDHAHVIALFDIGGNEIVIVLAIVLVLFGGEKMPELARGIGKSIREFKKAASGVEQELKKAMEEPPPKPTTPAPRVYPAPTPLPPAEPFQQGPDANIPHAGELPPPSTPPTKE